MEHCRKKLKNSDSRSSSRCFCWSNLPGKAIYEISKKLETRDEILHFKRVCSQWRNHSRTPPQKLWSFYIPLSHTIPDNSNVVPAHHFERPLAFKVCNIYLITPNDQSSNPWMIMAEEFNLGKIKVRHPLTGKNVVNFPPFLDMTQFQVLKLADGCNINLPSGDKKALLCSSSGASLDVVVLCKKGVLGKLSLKIDSDTDRGYSWMTLTVPKGFGFRFVYLDDVARFKDMICGLDRNGRLYILDTELMTISNPGVLVSEPIKINGMPIRRTDRRKRLVVDPASGELHLVVREKAVQSQKVRFKVYKINEGGKRWDVVENIGHERVLFVGIHHTFFALARHFPGCDGNSIVFVASCFPQYNGSASDQSLFGDKRTGVGVHRLGEGENFVLLPSDYPDLARIMFAGTIWPPPPWFCSRRSHKEEEIEEGDATNETRDVVGNNNASVDHMHDEVEMLSDSSDQNQNIDEEMKSNRSSTVVGSQTTNEREKTHSQIGNIDSGACCEKISDQIVMSRHDLTPEKGPDFTEEKVFDSIKMPVTPSISSDVEKSFTVSFQGIDIRSELLPTLQTIWAKHGNLIGQDTVYSKKMLGCALEELAELIITLENSTARTLNDSQTNYMKMMKSILSDIQRVGLKVEWLKPIIENATASLKS